MINSLNETGVPCPAEQNVKSAAAKQLKPLTKYAALMVAAALAGCGDDSENSLMNAHLAPPVAVDDAGETDAAPETGTDAVAEKAQDNDSGQGQVHYECGDLTNCQEKCVDTTVDTENCGSCGNVCGAEKPYCSNGGCTQCPDGLRNCNDGQGCIDFDINDKNCGGCGNSCNPGQTCLEGNCQ